MSLETILKSFNFPLPLDAKEQGYFLTQLQRALALREALQSPPLSERRDFSPLKVSRDGREDRYTAAGRREIQEGRVAALILCGGDASRLNLGPKALVPITRFCRKTLLQLICEKTAAASQLASRPLLIALMTSPSNHEVIEDYLQRRNFFGLLKDQIRLFQQEAVPCLDLKGIPVFKNPSQLLEFPGGNGALFHAMARSGLVDEWHRSGVTQIHILPIDNPLADPFDPKLAGFLAYEKLEMAIKVVAKDSPDEAIGTMGEEHGKPVVVEYFERTDEMRNWPYGNPGLYAASLEFVQRVAVHAKLSWHPMRRKVEGMRWEKEWRVEEIEVYKFEQFLFDLFPFADHIQPLYYPREETFSPLKNRSGDSSFETVQKDLLRFDRARYFSVTGVEVSDRIFELDPYFYYPTEEILKKWRGRAAPMVDYIEIGG